MSGYWSDLLPKELEVCGTRYEIRSDFRAALDICAALSDNDLQEDEKVLEALEILYVAFDRMPFEHYREALEKCMWFLNCGRKEQKTKSAPKLIDWQQDFQYIIAPVNRVCGKEVRAVDYMHWWTFISAYMEIGDCTLSQIVKIRDAKARGKKLDKADQEWYRENRDLVDFKTKYTEEEQEMLKRLGI